MIRQISIVCLGIGFLTVACNSIPGGSENKPPPSGKELAKQLVASWGDGTYSNAEWELNRHWVGTLKAVVKRGLFESDDNEDEPVRFNVLNDGFTGGPARKGGPVLLQESRNGYWMFAYYRAELPSVADLNDKEKLGAVLAMFGPQHGITDCCPRSVDWRWFTPVKTGQIRVLIVWGIVSQEEGKPEQMNDLIIREGFLRPSDPSDPKDAKAFPSQDVQDAENQAAVEAKDNANPEPLRSLLQARHTHDDLKTYFAAIRAFREKPDAELLKQLMARLDDGTCEMKGILEALFYDSPFEKKIGPWKPEKRRQAIELLLDALPSIKGENTVLRKVALEDAVELALRETEVGTLQWHGSGLNIDISSSRTSTSMESVMKSFTVGEGCSLERAGEILRDEIRRMWNARLKTNGGRRP